MGLQEIYKKSGHFIKSRKQKKYPREWIHKTLSLPAAILSTSGQRPECHYASKPLSKFIGYTLFDSLPLYLAMRYVSRVTTLSPQGTPSVLKHKNKTVYYYYTFFLTHITHFIKKKSVIVKKAHLLMTTFYIMTFP